MSMGSVAKGILAGLMVAFSGAAWSAPCVAPPMTAEAISQFKGNSQAFISPTIDARAVEASVRDLVGTDPSLAGQIVKLVATLPPRIKTAIAAGLAQATVACSTIDQQAALLIQQAVASLEDSDFQKSFAAIAGDLSTAATEAAMASASSSVGSVVIVNPNRSSSSTTFGGGGRPSLFEITASSATASSGGTNSGSSTSGNEVSATR